MTKTNTGSTRRHVVFALVCQVSALVLLACIRSDKLVSYVYDLPPNRVSNGLVAMAESWDGWMETTEIASWRSAFISKLDAVRQSPESF